MIETVQSFVLFGLAIAALVIVASSVLLLVSRSARTAFRRIGKQCSIVFALVCIACTVLARKGRISYPATDPTASYLIDAGSFVTNDMVRVSFTRIIVPDSAPLYIDRRPVSSDGDDTAWINHIETTFEEFHIPHDIEYTAATNFDWVVYTTWTPGPTVLTNGVWHAMWGRDQKEHRYFIPLRTSVRVNGAVIATPKSKEDSSNGNR